jgi:GLPGLI family protein
MKKSFALFLALSLLQGIANVSAQMFRPEYTPVDRFKVLDSAYVKFSYKLTSVKNPSNPKMVGVVDMQTLQIGRKASKYFSQYFLDYNISSQEMVNKGSDPQSFFNRQKGCYGYEIFKDNSNNKVKVTDLGSELGSNFQYEDDLSDLKWEIKSDTLTILSYLCQKAVTQFRGRDYEAWYTTDIPINNGPWKFKGLPGLIMKVADSKNEFVFECVGMQNLNEKEPIKFYSLDYTKVSRQELDKLYTKMYDDYLGYTLARTGMPYGFVYQDGVRTKATHSPEKYKYVAMELK